MNSKNLLAPLLLTASFVVGAETPSLAELWTIVQTQQQQIKALQGKLNTAQTQLSAAETRLDATKNQIEETDAKVEATADALEDGAPSGVKSSRSSWAERTQVGGYAELHYNNLEDHDLAGNGVADDLEQVDFHRFIIYLSHQFNDRIRFASELEIEHAVLESDDDSPGEVALEQAWVELDLNPKHHLRAGLDLLPIGIINGTHEPTTFYGVERNRVETEIIPTTWREGAVGARGELDHGFSYDVYLHSGLVIPTGGGSAFRPRSGRLEVAEAKNQDAGITGRLRYTGVPGLELATSLQYQRDYTGTADNADPDAYLVEVHGDWRHASGFGLRALFAQWHLGEDLAHGIDPQQFGAENLLGWYIEPAYRFALSTLVPGELGLFARYSEWDERNGLGGPAFHYVQFNGTNVGLNYWPHPDLVFKFDYQWESANGAVARERDGFNLAVGVRF